MIIVVQNLNKISGLASFLVDRYQPHILLAQEISLSTEDAARKENFIAQHTSKRAGYGTAILSRTRLTSVQRVLSPHAEFGGFIVKKTIVATSNNIQFVSFHGYNGQPLKDVSKLVDHIKAVLAVLEEKGSAVFAGDFNTWTHLHVAAVQLELEKVGFQRAYSWPYPGRETPLDHVFIRDLCLKSASHFNNESDHEGSILEVALENADMN